MGDLTALADSIRQEGMLQPIGVTEKKTSLCVWRIGARQVRLLSAAHPFQNPFHLRRLVGSGCLSMDIAQRANMEHERRRRRFIGRIE